MIPKAFVGSKLMVNKFNTFFREANMEIIKIDVSADSSNSTNLCVVAYYKETENVNSYEIVMTSACKNNMIAGEIKKKANRKNILFTGLAGSSNGFYGVAVIDPSE